MAERHQQHRVTAASVVVMGIMIATLCGDSAAADDDERIRFNRDRRPLLADACFHCHGPDEAARQADLRLDDAKAVLVDQRARGIIVPGAASQSELYRRITAHADQERMPPPESGRQLTAAHAPAETMD